MSMIGTFLVRSGILTSVHAFAVDPERGAFILILLCLYIGGALALFAARVGTVKEGSGFEPVSREGALVINNLLLSIILGVVMVGTLYPLFAEAMTGEKLSVGPPYFNKAAGPVALVLVAIMGAGPLLRWRHDSLRAVGKRLALPGLVGAAALAAVVLLSPGVAILPLLGLVLAMAVAVASVAPLWGRNLRRTPLIIWGMVAAHLGIAMSMAGMASEGAFTKETLIAARPGETAEVGPFSVRFDGVEPTAGQNWTAVAGRLTARRGDGEPFVMLPEARMFADPPTPTNEAAIETHWDGQIYIAIGEPDGQGRWQLRMWWKPWVTLIWFGGALVAFGGLLSLVGRVLRGRRVRREVPVPVAPPPNPLHRKHARGLAGRRWREALDIVGALRRIRGDRHRGRAEPGQPGRPADPVAAGRQGAARLRPARKPCRGERQSIELISAPGDRASSTSSPAGACPASPRHPI
jgi:cytochrome c-type biogenesis protein CcmF